MRQHLPGRKAEEASFAVDADRSGGVITPRSRLLPGSAGRLSISNAGRQTPRDPALAERRGQFFAAFSRVRRAARRLPGVRASPKSSIS